MQTWRQFLQRLRECFKKTPPSPGHLGGRSVPIILGVCEDCGAVVVEGLHRPTSTGFICQRCAASSRHENP